jgi:hypothetical protein
MSINPQNYMLNQQATALQHQIRNAGAAQSVIHREVTALKNDIAANKNIVVLNERMKKINNMIRNDQRASYQQPAPSVQPHYQPGHYQPGTFQAGHYQPGHYEPGHMQPNAAQSYQNAGQHVQPGPTFSHHQSNNLRYGLRQMSATLNMHPKF